MAPPTSDSPKKSAMEPNRLECLAIITARGGSKRIPRKNIRDFLGRPIIEYVIEVALQSNLFGEVMVSTDDAEIADLSQSAGAAVPFLRSPDNSNDFASTVNVIHEVLAQYQTRGRNFAYACCMYPTAPFIQTGHLRKGRDKLVAENLDTVFPVVPFSYPIWRGLKRESGKTSMVWPEYMKSRSQDLEPVFHDAGQWYWLRCATFSDQLWTSNTDSIQLREEEVQDIDTESDWNIAEMKYRMIQQYGNR